MSSACFSENPLRQQTRPVFGPSSAKALGPIRPDIRMDIDTLAGCLACVLAVGCPQG